MHPLFQQYQLTLLGRIKANALSKLSNSVEKIPSQREFFREVFRVWKLNPMAGLFYVNLLDCWRIDPVEFPAAFPAKAVYTILEKLNRDECFDRIYAEGRAHGEAGLPQFGCLVLGHRRPTNEPGYYAAIYSDNDSERCAFCSLVPDGVEGNGQVAVLTTDGWKNIFPEDVTNHAPARVMLATFRHHLDKIEPREIQIAGIKQDSAYEPPHDDELMRYLEAAMKGKMQITTATTSLKRVVPHNMDFCFRFPASSLQSLTTRIQRGYRPTMVVYWNGSEFIMSDDYPDYLAYRKAECEDVPVAILGDFPKNVADVIKCGGVELLPAVGMGSGIVYPAPPERRV
jgi:hypothetical protein